MTLNCGCEPDASGFGWCDKCVAGLRKKVWANMSEDRKNYDRHFAPVETMALDVDEGIFESRNYDSCSCHINPPCSYCTSKGEEDE